MKVDVGWGNRDACLLVALCMIVPWRRVIWLRTGKSRRGCREKKEEEEEEKEECFDPCHTGIMSWKRKNSAYLNFHLISLEQGNNLEKDEHLPKLFLEWKFTN